MQTIRNAGVVRVSEQGDRPDEHFHSPDVQLDAAKRWSKNRSERVVTHFREMRAAAISCSHSQSARACEIDHPAVSTVARRHR